MERAMPSDDRDRQLEKALARHLRSDAIDAACPDAETLAAYHERTLSLGEMAQWKQHIAECPRCQETLNLVQEPDVLQGSEEENQKMLELVGGEFAAAAAVSHMPLNEGVPAVLPVSRGAAATQAPKRAAALRWAVPVGALAAGLLVWVGVRETQQNKAMKSAQLEVAQNRPSVSSAPVAAAPAPKTALPDEYQNAQAKSRSLDELRRQDTTLSMTKPAGPVNKKSAAGGAAPVLSPALDKQKREEEAKALKDLSASMTAPAPTAPSLEVNNYAAQNREVPPTQNPQATPAGARGVTANEAANTGRMLGQQNQVARAPAQKTETLAVTVVDSALSQSMSDVLPEGGTIIVAPNDAYAWRVGSNGKIEHSTDNSRTWMLQKSGVTTDLTAGSATSGKVCWVVGKTGTVLLTTDRGKHWKQLTSPTKEDLGGVNAVDDKRASLWTVSHSKSFETNDGGATWSPVGVK
jgi:Photosynthesis system II assembly factor YCF48